MVFLFPVFLFVCLHQCVLVYWQHISVGASCVSSAQEYRVASSHCVRQPWPQGRDQACVVWTGWVCPEKRYHILRGHPSYHICHVCSAAKSCLTLCDPIDCSLPCSSVHGISQARILEWVATPSSRGSSPSRDRTQVTCMAGRFFTLWAPGKPQ